MLDYNVSLNKIEIAKNNIKKNIHIKNMSDLHLCESFDNKKLDIIYNSLFNNQTDYIFIDGDLIDSTNFVYKKRLLVKKYLYWLELISKKTNVFISLGNHDFSGNFFGNLCEDWENGFWEEVNKINNIHISHYENTYEDEFIYVFMLEPNYDYYYSLKKQENKKILLETLKNNKCYLQNLPKDKLKILLNHSPIYMTDKDVLKSTSEFDLVFSGHMHSGVIPFGFDKIIPGNHGIISPKKQLFPDNSRGTKKILFNENFYQLLLISGGITKFQENSGWFQKFNRFYKMDIDDILIKTKNKKH